MVVNYNEANSVVTCTSSALQSAYCTGTFTHTRSVNCSLEVKFLTYLLLMFALTEVVVELLYSDPNMSCYYLKNKESSNTLLCMQIKAALTYIFKLNGSNECV